MTVIYNKNNPIPVQKYTWAVKYVDQEGNNLQNPLKVGGNYVTGDQYDLNSLSDSQHPTTITTADGKTYVLVETKNGSGTFADGDQVMILTYRLKSTSWTPLKPSMPITPTKPTNPNKPANPNNPVQPGQPNKPGEPTASIKPTTSVNQQKPQNAKKLPQTGNNNEMALLGLGLSSIAAMLGLAGKKRKEG